MAPYDLVGSLGTTGQYLVFLFIGMGFGIALELSGFGDSRKLAAQFYLKDMTVLKVMFTGIVVAAVLLFLSTALGLLDFSRVWVNHTYLWPGIVGGLVMGVGFIVGGFCPGTSIVAASTLKWDGILFVLGVFVGVYAFGETVHLFDPFWHSSFMGRFMLPEWLGLPTGVVVLMLVFMALAMFWAGELSESYFGRNTPAGKLRLLPSNRYKLAGAAVLVLLAGVTALIGQPDASRRWELLAEKYGGAVESREVYIHPAEVVEWMEDSAVYTTVLDVRTEGDFNLFHVLDSKRVDAHDLEDAQLLRNLTSAPPNSLVFVISNGETVSTSAWKALTAMGVPNVYIVEGGYNHWLKVYPTDPCIAVPMDPAPVDDERLAYTFSKAVGHGCYSAHPKAVLKEPPTDCYLRHHPELSNAAMEVPRPNPLEGRPEPSFVKKVKLKKKSTVKGGCG